eukprot:EG_transcript_29657
MTTRLQVMQVTCKECDTCVRTAPSPAASPTHQPEALLQPIAEAVAREGRANIQGVHFFPFGPLRPTVEWAQGTLTCSGHVMAAISGVGDYQVEWQLLYVDRKQCS